MNCSDILLNVFLAIAVDNLADAESLTNIEKEEGVRKQHSYESISKSKSKRTQALEILTKGILKANRLHFINVIRKALYCAVIISNMTKSNISGPRCGYMPKF